MHGGEISLDIGFAQTRCHSGGPSQGLLVSDWLQPAFQASDWSVKAGGQTGAC